PDSLETIGYAYGKTVSDAEHSQVGVERVSSGRRKDLGVCTTKKEIAGVGFSTVTEEAAMSGIGTYVGGAVCIARVPNGKPKVWDYGIVVGRRAHQVVVVPNVLITSVEKANEVMRSEQQPAGNLEEENIEQLGDSDDDLLPSGDLQHDLSSKMNEIGKRARDTEALQPSSEARLLALRRRLGDDPEMIREIDQVIAFRQANLAKAARERW
ncbi:hypothetical protein PPTG_20419, partial [Phytophthora nicotianae INRA-310]